MPIERIRPLVAATLIVAWAAMAAAAAPGLEVAATPAELRVGDRLEVLASARGGDGWLWGELTVALEPGGPWELVDSPVEVPGTRPPAWRLTLVPMALGEQALPSISASARSSDGETAAVTSDEPVTVSVVSIFGGDDEEAAPAPLRDPIGARGFPWEWVLPVAGALIPLFAGAAWLWRGRGRPGAAGRTIIPPMAELEALASELDERVGHEPADGVCDRLAAGLRHYLERRTGEPAAEMTSFELRLLARRRGWPETAQHLVRRVMELADGIRFGRRPAGDDELRRAIGYALDAARGIEAFLDEADRERAAAGAGS